MKISITIAALTATTSAMVSEISPIVKLFGMNEKDMLEVTKAFANMGESDKFEIKNLKHVSITRVGDEIVYWIDDEVFIKYSKLYGKVARFIAPIIMSFKLFFVEFKEEVTSISSWLSESKDAK